MNKRIIVRLLGIVLLFGLFLINACTKVSTVAGSGSEGCVDGASTTAEFKSPSGLVTDPWNHIYVADAGCNKIRQIVSGPMNVSTYAGTGTAGCTDGNALTTATFKSPVDLDRAPDGNFYVADKDNHVIRKITTSATVETYAGVCGTALMPPDECEEGDPCKVKTYVPDTAYVDITMGTPQALFSYPTGVVVDAKGNVLVADYRTCTVRKISPKGVVTTVGEINGEPVSAYVHCCGCSGPFSYPAGIDLDSAGNIYVAEYWGHRISKIDAVTENITRIAGSSWGYKDGVGTQAMFSHPYHLSVDKATGNIYVADLGNNRIRKIANDGSWTVTTMAGNGITGYVDGDTDDAEFNHPRGIHWVEDLLIYI